MQVRRWFDGEFKRQPRVCGGQLANHRHESEVCNRIDASDAQHATPRNVRSKTSSIPVRAAVSARPAQYHRPRSVDRTSRLSRPNRWTPSSSSSAEMRLEIATCVMCSWSAAVRKMCRRSIQTERRGTGCSSCCLPLKPDPVGVRTKTWTAWRRCGICRTSSRTTTESWRVADVRLRRYQRDRIAGKPWYPAATRAK